MVTRISASTVIIHIVLALAAILCIAPVLNVIAISFSESHSALAGKVYFTPKNFTLASYNNLLTEKAFSRAFIISTFRVLAAVSISMPILTCMAYALSKTARAFRERNVVMWITVFTMLFHGGLIPTYMIVKSYGLIDNFWVLVLPQTMNIFNLLVLMNFFRGVPGELEEAALIDGASAMRTLVQVYLPVSLPSLATITLFTVVHHWNDFYMGLIYMNKPVNYPLQTYLRSLTFSIEMLVNMNMDPEQIEEYMKISGLTYNASKIVVAMLPVLVIYPLLQRYFVSGLVIGAVKE